MHTSQNHNMNVLHYFRLVDVTILNSISAILTNSLIHNSETVQNSKKLQTTTEMWLLTLYSINTHFDASITYSF